jgi:hypothetical protein
MGLLDFFGGGGEGGGLLGGLSSWARDVAPIMKAAGGEGDMGTAQFRVQQMQDRRYLRAQDEMLKKQASVMAERMGLDPALAQSPETVFSIYKAQKQAEIEKANRAGPAPPQPLDIERKLDAAGIKDPMERQKYILQSLNGSGTPRQAPAGYEWAPEGTLRPITGGPQDPATIAANRKAEPLPADLTGRLAVTEEYLDQAPNINKDVEAGNLTGPIDHLQAKYGWGRKNEVYRQIQSGVDALRRSLTGAGMPVAEANNYVSRYEPALTDDAPKLASKQKQLQAELSRYQDLARQGRGGGTSAPKPPQGGAPDRAALEAEARRRGLIK